MLASFAFCRSQNLVDSLCVDEFHSTVCLATAAKVSGMHEYDQYFSRAQ